MEAAAEAEEAPVLEALEETLHRMEDAMRSMRREMDKTDDAVGAVARGLKEQARMLRSLHHSVHGIQRSHSEFRPDPYFSPDAATVHNYMPFGTRRGGARRAASCGEGLWVGSPTRRSPALPAHAHSQLGVDGGRVRFTLPAAPAGSRSLLAAGRARPAPTPGPAPRRAIACSRATFVVCTTTRTKRHPPLSPRFARHARAPPHRHGPSRPARSSDSFTTTTSFDLDLSSGQPCPPATSVSESPSGPASTCSFASSYQTAASSTSCSMPATASLSATTVSSCLEPPCRRESLPLSPSRTASGAERSDSAHFTPPLFPKEAAGPTPRASASECSTASSCLPPPGPPAPWTTPRQASRSSAASEQPAAPPLPAPTPSAQVQAALRRRLVNAVRAGKTKEVRELLDLGASVNFHAAGRTPLHRAAQRANAGVVSLLLKSGADAGARDCFGRTPLHVAAAQDSCGLCVAILIDASAPLEARNRVGQTPLHYAAEAGNEAAVRALVAAGASTAAADARGRTPLLVAKTLCVHRLLRQGGKQKKDNNSVIEEEDSKYYPSSNIQIIKAANQSRKSTRKVVKSPKRPAKSAEQINKPKDGAVGGNSANNGKPIVRVTKVIDKIDKLVQEVGKRTDILLKSKTDKSSEQVNKNRGHKSAEQLLKSKVDKTVELIAKKVDKTAEQLAKKADKTADNLLKKKVNKSTGLLGKLRKGKDTEQS